jgi:dTDP-4-dehydrorhamnose reductase
MKLFYQLSRDEQEAAIEHCADLVANNALEKGLRIEVSDDEAGQELKQRLDSMLEELTERKDLKSREQKIEFLMNDQAFADTIFELASEMAHSSFYHTDDELTITMAALAERIQDNEEIDEEAEAEPEPKTVDELVKDQQAALKKHQLN